MKNKLTNSTLLLISLTGCSITIDGSGLSDGNSTSSITGIPELSSGTDSEGKTSTETEGFPPTSTTSVNLTEGIISSTSTSESTGFDLGDSDTETRFSTGETNDNETGNMNSNCGNFIVENTEECDDGPSGSAICTKYCKFSFCGDGHINLIVGEECDDGNPTDNDECSNGCERPRWVFLTSDYIGPPNFGGLAKADEFCQNDADKFGFIGNYKAWLSDSDPNNDPIVRFGDFSKFNGWYRLPSDPPTPIGKGAEFKLNLLAPVNVMLTGTKDLIVESVWTNTKPTGFAVDYTNNCNNWTMNSLSFSTVVGSPQSVTNGWTTAGGKNCGSGVGSKLYCFEIGE